MKGEKRREELALHRTRLLMASMHNFSGYAKKALSPQDVFPLDIDEEGGKKPIEMKPEEIVEAWQAIEKQRG